MLEGRVDEGTDEWSSDGDDDDLTRRQPERPTHIHDTHAK